MGERIKKIFLSRLSISISGGLIAYFVGVIINASASKINLLDSLLNLPVKIYHIKIPDFFLVILIIAIFISLAFINKKFQGWSPKKIREMLAENEELKTEIEKTKEEEKLELNEEHYIILETLASSEDECEPKESLYETYFKKKGRAIFNLAISELKRSNLITLQKDVGADFFELGVEILFITDSGYACLRNRKDI